MSPPPETSNKPKKPQQKGPTNTKGIKETIIVASTPPGTNAQRSNAQCFTPSSRTPRTSPQTTTHLTNAPSQLTRGKPGLKDDTDTRDESLHANGTKDPGKSTLLTETQENSPSPITVHNTESQEPKQLDISALIQAAQNALNIALKHLHESFQRAAEKVKNGADPNKITIETPCPVFQEIGTKVAEALNYIGQHVTHPENIGERLSRIEKVLQEIMTRVSKTYAQTAATSSTTD